MRPEWSHLKCFLNPPKAVHLWCYQSESMLIPGLNLHWWWTWLFGPIFLATWQNLFFWGLASKGFVSLYSQLNALSYSWASCYLLSAVWCKRFLEDFSFFFFHWKLPPAVSENAAMTVEKSEWKKVKLQARQPDNELKLTLKCRKAERSCRLR